MTRDANTGEALALVDEWARAGVALAALAPGSRSTPLALALAADDRIRLEVFLDERSAAFFALGAAKASNRPAVVLTTSGTAAANVHPAVVEAAHGRAPLLVCTADRPPELRDTGANQAIDQVKLFGDAVRWFADVGVPEDRPDAGRHWRSVAARAVRAAAGPPAGPVHLNLAFREPLVPTGDPVVPAPGRPDGAPWVTATGHRPVPHAADVDRLIRAVTTAEKGVIVAGWAAGADSAAVDRFAGAAGWPVLADPLSGLRAGALSVSTYDALLRVSGFAESHRPEYVLHLGAPLTGRTVTTWLADVDHRVVVDPDGAWLDPTRSAAEHIVAAPEALLEALSERLPRGRDGEWLRSWLDAEAAARKALDDLLDSWEEPFEGRVARDLIDCLPDGSTLVVGSSMPVRDVESFARPRTGVRFVANRGASGIDGFNSTLLGAAAVAWKHGPTVGLAGDLTFLHDAGALLGTPARDLDAVLVVVDNDGGGVFSFLPQAQLPDHFETVFGTPHRTDLTEVASAYGVPARRIGRASELARAVAEAIDAGGARVIVVPSDRALNVARHRRAWEAVAAVVPSGR